MKIRLFFVLLAIFLLARHNNSFILRKSKPAHKRKSNNSLSNSILKTMGLVSTSLILVKTDNHHANLENSKKQNRKLVSELHHEQNEARKLEKKFNRLLSSKLGNMRGVKKINNFKSSRIENKVIKIVSRLSGDLTLDKKKRQLLIKEYPRLLRFINKKSISSSPVNFSQILSLPDEYMKKYHKTDMFNKMGLLLNSMNEVMRQMPSIMRNLNK